MKALLPQTDPARLLLRPWRDEDAAPFAAMNADPELMRHYPAPLSARESRALMEHFRAHERLHGFSIWALELPGLASCAGSVGLLKVSFEAHFTPAIEIGWKIARPFQGRGLATEAARAVLDFGFKTLALPEIVAMTTPGNLASMRVMEKLGMQRRVEDDFELPKLPLGHALRPHVLYRLKPDPR